MAVRTALLLLAGASRGAEQQALKSRFRKPWIVNSPWWMASRKARSSAIGRRAGTRGPCRRIGFGTELKSSSIVVLSSTLARASINRAWAAWLTSARRCRSALPWRSCRHFFSPSAFLGTPPSKIFGVVDRGFRCSEHHPVFRMRWVVSLKGVRVHPKLDPRTFAAVLQIPHHLAGKVSRHGAST